MEDRITCGDNPDSGLSPFLERIDDIGVFKELEVGAKAASKKFTLPNMDKIAYIDVECEE